MTARRDEGYGARQCARFGCSAIAVATFTFDSNAQTVWLDTPAPGAARAGELCGRHARTLTPPRGWHLEDRRGEPATPRSVATRRLAAGPSDDVLEAELDDLLDAQSPLLARAFRNSGTV